MHLFLTSFFFIRICRQVLATPVLKMYDENLVFHSCSYNPQTIYSLRESFRSLLQHFTLFSDHVQWEGFPLPGL